MVRYPRYRPLNRKRRGFSLVELVIVVTIIGIIASIAVPRVSRGLSDAEGNALEATLANVRKAVDMYYAEHGSYPGYTPSTTTPNNAKFVDQLIMYSDGSGNTNATHSSTYRFGPYIRSPFPGNPRNQLSTVYVKATPGVADPVAGSYGWVAVLSHGYFGVSLTDAVLVEMGFDTPEKKEGVRAKTL